MDNTDFSFLWRKEMTKKWVAAALSELAPGGRRTAALRFPKRLGLPPRDPLAILPAFS